MGLKDFKPKILVTDGAKSITNGFKAAFAELKGRVMCWAHMIRKEDEILSKVSNLGERENLRRDIFSLQLSRNREIFQKASSLFTKKWSKSSEEVVFFLIILKTNG